MTVNMFKLGRVLSARFVFRSLVLLAVFILLTGTAWVSYKHPERVKKIAMMHEEELGPGQSHPIDYLMMKAEGTFQRLLEKETTTLGGAAEAYRQRRGRHPPPGFDKWFEYAQKNHAIIVEDFFDQIHHDLDPFWGVKAKEIRRQAKHSRHRISVRDGKASLTSEEERDWLKTWMDLVKSIQDKVPDVDIPMNVMDESRIIAPWEEVNRNVKAERQSRSLPKPKKVVSEFTSLKEFDENPGTPEAVEWTGPGLEPFWDTARVGCGPESESRDVPAATNFTGPPPAPGGFPAHSFQGFVQNWTLVKDACQQSNLRESHGTFIEPISISTTHSLIPLFGGSKLSMNNDILIPPPAYYTDNPFYSGGETHGEAWRNKKEGVVWRGVASGGRNKEDNWTRFHRHRFVSMLDGKSVQAAEQNPEHPGQGPNFVVQSYQAYHLGATQYMDLGSWLGRVADVGFTSLLCHPPTGDETCPHTDPYYSLRKNMPMKDQYEYRFLPDIDGNSFSGRYLAFLRSTSLPIKATIYSEWHDSRLTPWLHFVPMDNSFVDIYGIIDYFLGTGVRKNAVGGPAGANMGIKVDGSLSGQGNHDAEAERIALKGKEWAEKVLRKEDMKIYTLRLLLEYARVSDDKREKMGFVADLET